MRMLFIGGPGRSGTSLVAARLGAHPEVAALADIELKILCEKNGLQDLHHALSTTYSPNRATVALSQFRLFTRALVKGQFGQPSLTTIAPAEAWEAIFERFAEALCDDGHPVEQTGDAFFTAARALVAGIAALAAARTGGAPRLFVEKTPHNLLAIRFLTRLMPGAQYLHVMRDPRSIAWSLTAMSWGPNRLDAAASWVASYCRAWLAAETEAAELGVRLVRLHIEDAVAAQEATSADLAAWLGIAGGHNLVQSETPAILNRWAARASAEDRALLDARLGGWVRHFGYLPEAIGRRAGAPSGPASDAPPESPAESPTRTPPDTLSAA